jgi:hypothetical protein
MRGFAPLIVRVKNFCYAARKPELGEPRAPVRFTSLTTCSGFGQISLFSMR